MGEDNEKNKYYDVYITDFKIHSTVPRKPTPWYRAIFKSRRNQKPGRFYAEGFSVKNNNFQIDLFTMLESDPNFQKYAEIAKKTGKEIRLVFPKKGVPVFLAKDAIEKVKAIRKKRRPLTRFWRDSNIK